MYYDFTDSRKIENGLSGENIMRSSRRQGTLLMIYIIGMKPKKWQENTLQRICMMLFFSGLIVYFRFFFQI